MTEIEKELNRRADIIIRQEKQIQIDAEQIRALQKQNGELTDKVKKLEKQHDIVRDERNLFQERCEDILANYYCDHKCKCADLEKENAELKSENQKWKDEWQEQVQKATDEGYARTLQTMQLTKAKEIIKAFLDSSDLNIKHKAEEFLGEF